MSLVDFGVPAFGALFVIVDPTATVRAFRVMTDTKTTGERIAIANRSDSARGAYAGRAGRDQRRGFVDGLTKIDIFR
jgi:hypothetical protein